MLQMSGESFRRLLVKVRKMRLVLYSGMRALELMLLPGLARAFILGSTKCSANERQEMKYQGGQNCIRGKYNFNAIDADELWQSKEVFITKNN